MGGRGRTPDQKDRWDWVQELSDYRLANYGQMAAHKTQDDQKVDFSKEALHFACQKEFERRHGNKPNW